MTESRQSSEIVPELSPQEASPLPHPDVVVFLCRCGEIIPETVELDAVAGATAALPGVASVHQVDFLCSEEGLASMAAVLEEGGAGRVVVAACSPKEHEATFQGQMASSGVNPYLLQMANIREQVAWVTESKDEGTKKCATLLRGAVARSHFHEALFTDSRPVNPDVMVVGAGPAGLKAALTLAEAGRRVLLVEKTQAIGGMPVLFEEVFPNMECGPCMLEPLMDKAIHGDLAENIEILTGTEVQEVVGSFGNFSVRLGRSPRYVDTQSCIGCALCTFSCPVEGEDPSGMFPARKAIDFPYPGALPNVPVLDPKICLHFQGDPCTECQDNCPIPEAIIFPDQASEEVRAVGAMILAIGAGNFDPAGIPALGYAEDPDVRTHLEAERALASDGPSSGTLTTSKGSQPESVAIVHCVGSLDSDHHDYCSGICCQEAFKLNLLISHKNPGTRITHLYRELVAPGKGKGSLLKKVRKSADTEFVRYSRLTGIQGDNTPEGRREIVFDREGGGEDRVHADLVILCPAVEEGNDARDVSRLTGVELDRDGFFQAVHERTASTESSVRGIYLAGSCQAPGDIREAMAQGTAAAGRVLAAVVEGRELTISPVVARVQTEVCSGCGVCVSQCPYKAITMDRLENVAAVDPSLCQGCGTCGPACPSGAMSSAHFTDQQIVAEFSGILA